MDKGMLGKLEIEREEVIAFLQQMVRIPSLSGDEGETADLILAKMQDSGYDEAWIDPVGNVIGKIKGKGTGPTVMLNGHMDVVEPSRREAWLADPFSAEIIDGKVFGEKGEFIYGRGSADMKAGVVAMVLAGKAIKKAGIVPPGDILVTAVVKEETATSKGAAYLITGDRLSADAAIVTEPSNLAIMIGEQGVVGVTITTIGRIGHSSTPGMGVNAIEKMLLVIDKLHKMRFPSHELIGNGFHFVQSIESKPMWFSFVPDSCSIKVLRHIVPPETKAEALKGYRQLLDEISKSDPDFKADVKLHAEMHIVQTDTTLPVAKQLINGLQESCRAVGVSPTISAWLAGTDAAYLSEEAKIPCIGFGPGRPELAHSSQERVKIDDVVLATEVYTRTLVSL